MLARTELLARAAGLLLLAPLPAAAQPMVKVALLCPGSCSRLPNTIDAADRAFLAGLERAGYVLGRNASIDVSSVGVGPTRLPAAARRLVERKVDVIVAVGNEATRAARHATTDIPIVMMAVTDAVEEGFVPSLAGGGGNVTGLSVQAAQLAIQRIALLKEINPRLARVAVISSPRGEVDQARFVRIRQAAEAVGVQTSLLGADTVLDLEQALDSMGPERPEGLLLFEGGGKSQIGSEIFMFALQRRLATAGGSRSFVQGGGLLAYGPYLPHLYERVATYVGKILNGTRPGDLPVEKPTRFELSVNMATAKTIGLTIPQKLLLAADYLIE